MTKQVSLSVNGKAVSTDYFVAGFIDHTVRGMLEALEGTGPVEKLDFAINGDKISISLNGKNIPVNEFASKMIKSTTAGMLAPLKGVDGAVDQVKITLAH